MNEYLKIIEIAKALELTPTDLKRAYDCWIAAETPAEQKAATANIPERAIRDICDVREYKMGDITEAIERDNNLNFLYKQAQILLGKTLSSTDVQILYSFYDYYGFPAEVAVMMLTYATTKEKRNMRYIEKIAIDWAEKEILTVDDAENHIKRLEQRAKRENKIRQALGIFDRKLTETEERFISAWANELKVPSELVPIAYERTINATGKLSCAYMDKIFKNWTTAGIKTAEQLANAEAEYKSKQTPNNSVTTVKPSKFNNFAGTSGVDYATAAQQKISKM